MVYVRGAGAKTPSDLLALSLTALGALDPDADDIHPGDTSAELLDQLAQVRQRWIATNAADPTPVLVLDVAPSAAGNALFGALRDELWAIGLQWLVTVATDDAGELLKPPADAFFEARIDLADITDEDAEELLEQRLGALPVNFLQDAVAIAGGNPRRLLDVARELNNGSAKWPDLSKAYAAREHALAQLGRPAHMLAKELEVIGAASASDPQLQERMGWTRSRLVQVLDQLEENGLATAKSVKPKGQGRPRKVYRLEPAVTFLRKQQAGAE